jgi:hypothetical protein
MLRNRRQSGEGRLGCIFGLIILVAAVFIAYKMIPVKVKAAEIRETVVDEAKSAGTHHDDRIREAIIAKATENGFTITEKDIDIKRTANQIYVTVEYTVPIEFPGYTFQWHLVHRADNPIF